MDQRSFSEIRVVRVRAGPVGSGRARVVEFSLYIAGACWCRGWLAGVTHAGVMCREVVLAANAVHNERLQAQPTVLLCGSACPLGEYHSYRPTAAIAFSAVILLVVQIRVNFYLFKTSNVNSFGIVDLFFNICSKFIRTLVPSFNKFMNAQCKKTKSPAAQATVERPIALLYEANFCLPSIFFVGPFVVIHWTHSTVNSICIMSFSP